MGKKSPLECNEKMLHRGKHGSKYVDIFMKTDKSRVENGEREFTVGKFYYEKGEMELAAKYLRIPYNISTSRCLFNGRDNKKYKDFIKEYIDNEKKANLRLAKSFLNKRSIKKHSIIFKKRSMQL